MAGLSDGLSGTEALICEVVGVSQSLRQNWTKSHGLRRRGRGEYEELDVSELAALRALLEVLGPADGSIAWELSRHEIVDAKADRALLLLFDPQDKTAKLAASMSEVVSALPYGRPIVAVRLDDPITRAIRAFRLAAAKR